MDEYHVCMLSHPILYYVVLPCAILFYPSYPVLDHPILCYPTQYAPILMPEHVSCHFPTTQKKKKKAREDKGKGAGAGAKFDRPSDRFADGRMKERGD